MATRQQTMQTPALGEQGSPARSAVRRSRPTSATASTAGSAAAARASTTAGT